jgi:basic amino acid/polyamine antiporter, APA family
MHDIPHPPVLKRSIGGLGFFTLAFGCIVGSGWVVVLGEWLSSGGPGGAVLGFLAGGLLMSTVAAAYAELVARMPRAGGEFLFVLNGLGRNSGFLTGWFLTLHLTSFTAFEAFALTWFLENLFPALAQAPVLYTSLGFDVTVFNLPTGVACAVLLTLFNLHGSRLAVGIQSVITIGFIIISLMVIATGFAAGETGNLLPLFDSANGSTIAGGVFWLFANSLLFLNGFQTAANAVEERAHTTSLKTVAIAMIGAVMAAALFYCLIILSISSLLPWRQLIGMELPAAHAFEHVLPGGLAMQVVLITAIISLAKAWNAIHLSASRLVLAQAREGLLPRYLDKIHPVSGVPSRAIIAVGTTTIIWMLLGRGAIVPILNMSVICVATIMIMALLALYRQRRVQAEKPDFVLPGGTKVLFLAVAAAALAAGVSIWSPFIDTSGIPVEIQLLVAWLALGVILRWRQARHERGHRVESGK